MSLSKAQKVFLREHLDEFTPSYIRGRIEEDGFRPRMLHDRGSKTWNFVARVEDAGLIEIVDDAISTLRFPYGWVGTRLTAKGREAAR